MEVVEFKEGDVLVLVPDGSVAGREETNAIERKLGAAHKSSARLLVFDCTHVGQLTSAAIRLLLTTSRKLEGRDGRLVLCSMNAQVKKAFSISGFDQEFTIAASRDEAMQLVIEPAHPRSTRAAKKSQQYVFFLVCSTRVRVLLQRAGRPGAGAGCRRAGRRGLRHRRGGGVRGRAALRRPGRVDPGYADVPGDTELPAGWLTGFTLVDSEPGPAGEEHPYTWLTYRRG